MNYKHIGVAAMTVVFAMGCAGPNSFSMSGTGAENDPAEVAKQSEAFAQTQPDWSRPFVRALYRDGEWGAVLNLNRLGLAAMERGDFAMARKAFDEAITRVESIYADDANAAAARSVFNAEKVKDFKGEPYERAMMYFYRGLLYLQEGDFQNARAAFLAADRHDTLSSAEATAYAGDFGMMKYLAGWVSACDGDAVRGAQLLQEARTADATVQALPEHPGRSLVLVDSGPAPVKWGAGEHREILKFRPGEGDDPIPVLRLAKGSELNGFAPIGDVTYQATTRGGREVDGILAGKAKFKDGASAVGDTAMLVGTQLLGQAGLSGDRGLANAGFAGMLLGFVAKGIEKASTPEADVRAWDTLPARVLVQVTDEPIGESTQLVLGGQAAALPLYAEHGSCTVAWGRTRTASVAGNSAATAPSAEANRGDRNRSFRSMLVSELAPSR